MAELSWGMVCYLANTLCQHRRYDILKYFLDRRFLVASGCSCFGIFTQGKDVTPTASAVSFIDISFLYPFFLACVVSPQHGTSTTFLFAFA